MAVAQSNQAAPSPAKMLSAGDRRELARRLERLDVTLDDARAALDAREKMRKAASVYQSKRQTMREAAADLCAIKDGRLYEEEWGSWANFCRKRFPQVTQRCIDRLIVRHRKPEGAEESVDRSVDGLGLFTEPAEGTAGSAPQTEAEKFQAEMEGAADDPDDVDEVPKSGGGGQSAGPAPGRYVQAHKGIAALRALVSSFPTAHACVAALDQLEAAVRQAQAEDAAV